MIVLYCTVLYRVLQPSSVPRIYMPTCFLLLVLPSMIYDGTNSFVVLNENTCFPVKPIEEYTYLNVQYIIYNKRSSPIQKWLCISLYTHTKQLLFSFTYNPTSHTIFPNYTVHCHCTLCACQPYCWNKSSRLMAWEFRNSRMGNLFTSNCRRKPCCTSADHQNLYRFPKNSMPKLRDVIEGAKTKIYFQGTEMCPCSSPGRQIGYKFGNQAKPFKYSFTKKKLYFNKLEDKLQRTVNNIYTDHIHTWSVVYMMR